jgi:hypothetical protein
MTTLDTTIFTAASQSEYQRQINRVGQKTGFIASIEATTQQAVESIQAGVKSFVIYGEPQSGKTEMMICLTARLLDAGFSNIIILVNDNVDLQNQNLQRFRRSGLSPAPRSLQELKPEDPIKSTVSSVIFCKKNSKDLQVLSEKLRKIKQRIIIDDEADFATPNAKINKNEQSKINKLVDELRNQSHGGIYIGVTATPARLDLNHTLENDQSSWVYFEPYPTYSGHKVFFPNDEVEETQFCLVTLPDEGDKPEYLVNALTRFVVNVAYLNITGDEKNYCMLVHTSGLRDEHNVDKDIVEKFFDELQDNQNKNHYKRYDKIFEDASKRLDINPNIVARYIFENRSRKAIKVINSANGSDPDNIRGATDPETPFTIAIGGNIISRGVTFNNLLTMFFTRATKHQLQQDTYIQRARMFGNRTGYLEFFELHIPKALYQDWHRAFALHGLSMASIAAGKPVWLEDKRIKAAAGTSIDKSRLSIDTGEISFELVKFPKEILKLTEESVSGYAFLDKVNEFLPSEYIGEHIFQFIKSNKPSGDKSLVIHASRCLEESKNIDAVNIRRDRGLFGGQDYEREKFPEAVHHFKFFYNENGFCRLIYNYKETDRSIRFLRLRAAK